MKIFLDAGHNFSGWNTGAVGNGMREQDITFDVAKFAGLALVKRGFDVMLSRPTLETNLGHDNSSSINARWQASNTWKADYFISIHANAGGGTGAETLYYKDDSLKFAAVMQNVYSAEMGLRNRRVWRRDDIGVIRNTNCPSILLEVAFIDSPASNPDAGILRSRRPEMGEAVAKGMLTFLGMDYEAPPNEKTPDRFNTVDQLPSWAVPTIVKLVEKGVLKGDGKGLDLSIDMVRIFVVHDRAGMYD